MSSARSPLLLGTRSLGKLRELRPMFEGAGFAVVDATTAGIPESAEEDALEVAQTFEENALLKARYFRRLSGMDAIADDSGIEVRALGGAPGVVSKRWSNRPDLSGQALDDENNALLLRRLEGVSDRGARYVCAAAYCGEAGEIVVRGKVEGVITREARGRNGFGYDPYFESLELGRTFGEVTLEEKARVSHRARAFENLLSRLKKNRVRG